MANASANLAASPLSRRRPVFVLMRGDRLVIARAAAGPVVVMVPAGQGRDEVFRLASVVLCQEEFEELQDLIPDGYGSSDDARFELSVPGQRGPMASEFRSAAGR